MRPSPAARLAERLERLPDGCRAILAALERGPVEYEYLYYERYL